MKKILFPFIFVFFTTFCFAQTATAGLYNGGGIRSAEEGFAAEEFRRGVQAYYRGTYSEAIIQFEKALSYMPNDNLILEWLGKSYYKAGLEGNALESWEYAANTGYGGLLLKNKIEIIKERRIPETFFNRNTKLTESGSFNGINNEVVIFSEPISVLPNNDGTAWVLAHGSNELLLLNVNGVVITRVTGPLNGFDRPTDLIRLNDGNIIVSESAGDRLALLSSNGKFIKYFGSKGIKNGQLLGPQYLAQDFRNNVYVSDYGNKRIVVFDNEGNALFTFGKKNSDFSGLKGPTGVAIIGESLYVADDVLGCIFEFDLSGNYKRKLVENKTFKHPESMKVWNNFLVICDSNRVISVDCQTGAIFENVKTGNAPARLTSAVPDINGNVLVTDIKNNEVYVMAQMHELIGGLFVQIERINAQKFPEVFVDVKIENRHRNPVVGLKDVNFYFTEEKRPVVNQKFLGASANNSFADITIIIDRKQSMKVYESQINSSVRELANCMDPRTTLRIISAGQIPALEYVGSPSGAKQFSVAGLKTNYANNVPMDLAVRLAANDLINAEKKRAIIFISDGDITQNSFDKYSLNEMTSYLNNNFISFLMIQVEQKAIDDSLDYLVKNTNGTEYYMFRPEGLSKIIQDIVDIPSGVYTFSYTSTLGTNFGEKYLPIEVEVYLMNRSGRDESGYFAPLQ